MKNILPITAIILSLTALVISLVMPLYKEYSSPRKWPLSIQEVFSTKREIGEEVSIYGYLVKAGKNRYEIHQDKKASEYADRTTFPYFTIIYPEDKLNAKCVNTAVKLTGKLFTGIYAPAMDEIRRLSSLGANEFCIERSGEPINYYKELIVNSK